MTGAIMGPDKSLCCYDWNCSTVFRN